MKNKILVIDRELNHHEYIIALSSYFQKENNCFVSGDLYKNLQQEISKNYKMFIDLNIKISNRNFFLEGFFEGLKYEEIVMSTFYFNIREILMISGWLLFRKSIYIGVHNLNFHFIGNQTEGLLLKIFRPLINKKVKGFFVLNKEIKKNALHLTSKDIKVTPFKLPLRRQHTSKNKQVNIVIPGAVELKKRDYEEIFSLIERCSNSNLKFVFLGKVIDTEVIPRLQKLNNNGKNEVVYFESYVNQEEFNEIVQAADYILAPLKPYEVFRGNKEYYGITKASGAEFDALKYNKKLIIPHFYKITDKKINYIHYKNYEELKQIINSL